MKKRFLELVEMVNGTGVVDVMYGTSTAEELKEVWQKFLSANSDLITKIEEWAEHFKTTKCEAIFEIDEEVENPMEIAVVIFIINDENLTECEIFEDWRDLLYAIDNISNDFTNAVSDFMLNDLIYSITVEDIYPYVVIAKEKFLELVNKVKETRIVEAIYGTSNVKELKEVWQKFLSENPDLITKIGEWAEKFEEADCEAIFDREEELENPMEVVVVIFIINDEQRVSEGELFEEYVDLTKAIEKIDNEVAKRIAEFIKDKYICSIDAKDIFPEEDASGEVDQEN